MRMRQRILIASGVAAILVGVGYFLLRDRYRPSINAALSGELRQVNFRPHVDRELVTVTDPVDVNAIRAAVFQARGLSVASWPPTTCDLQFVFSDGPCVDMKMSPTGLLSRSLLEQEPPTSPEYAVLGWNGHQRGMDAKPFIYALRRANRSAETQPAGAADAR